MARKRVEVDTVGKFKALGHPLRQQVLAELTEPMSASDLAARLEVPSPRLYHHIRLLQQHGFIAEAGSRRVRSNDERLYVRVSGTIRFSGDAVAPPQFRSQLRAEVADAVDREAGAFVGAVMAWEKGEIGADPPIGVSRRTAQLTRSEARQVGEQLDEAIARVLDRRRTRVRGAAEEWVYVTMFFPEVTPAGTSHGSAG